MGAQDRSYRFDFRGESSDELLARHYRFQKTSTAFIRRLLSVVT